MLEHTGTFQPYQLQVPPVLPEELELELLLDELELLEEELELLLDELELLEELELLLDELELLLEELEESQLLIIPPEPLWLSQVVRPIQL